MVKVFKRKKNSCNDILRNLLQEQGVSFEVGMKKLNGDVVVLDQDDSQLGRGESFRILLKF